MSPNPPFMAGIPELLVLGLLKSREEMYGYELVAAIGVATNGVVFLEQGVVYPLLHELEESGFLKSRNQVINGRKRTYYALTSQGIRRLFDLTDDWRRLEGALGRVLA
ncbi:MAG: PadR family transcriptional regulator [Rhizomicrobium sp.]